jgi:Leucine-rich repeat (LRR) protein
MKPPDRQRFHFTLRTLAVILSVSCAMSAVIAHKMRCAATQKEAVAAVRASGGIVWYDFAVDENLEPIWHTNPDGHPVLGRDAPVMEYLRERIGVDYLATPVSMSWHGPSPAAHPGTGDLAQVGILTQLISADLRQAPIDNLSGLSTVTALKYLDVTRTAVYDLSPLATLTDLEQLNLSYSNVSDLTPLKSMAALERLNLIDTFVHDLSGLEGVTSLRELNGMDTAIHDLSPLAKLTHVEELNLWSTNVSDLSPLAGTVALKRLSLYHTSVSDLSPLAGATGLQELYLVETSVRDLAPLAGVTGLQKLNLDRTLVRDLAPLAGVTGLQTLSLSGTLVRDLSPLAQMTKLQRLDLVGTLVSDVTPLTGAVQLRELYLTDTHVANVAPLEHLTDLRTLGLVYTDVTNEQVAELKKALPYCDIFHQQRGVEQREANRKREVVPGRDPKVIEVYEGQQKAVVEVNRDFAERLRSEGYVVKAEATRNSGHGEWASFVVVRAWKEGSPPHLCYVEVTGAVSHDSEGNPTWQAICPMRISLGGKDLESRFVEVLAAEFGKRGWEYAVDSRCRHAYETRPNAH